MWVFWTFIGIAMLCLLISLFLLSNELIKESKFSQLHWKIYNKALACIIIIGFVAMYGAFAW